MMEVTVVTTAALKMCSHLHLLIFKSPPPCLHLDGLHARCSFMSLSQQYQNIEDTILWYVVL